MLVKYRDSDAVFLCSQDQVGTLDSELALHKKKTQPNTEKMRSTGHFVRDESQRQLLLLVTFAGVRRAVPTFSNNKLCHGTDFDFLARLVQTHVAAPEVKAEHLRGLNIFYQNGP